MDEEARLTALEERIAGLEWLLFATMMSLVENGRLEIKRLIDAAEFMTAYAVVKNSPGVGRAMVPIVVRLQACEPLAPAIRRVFEADLHLLLDAGPERKAALESWQSTASAEELADDLLEARRKLAARSRPGKRRAPLRKKGKR